MSAESVTTKAIYQTEQSCYTQYKHKGKGKGKCIYIAHFL